MMCSNLALISQVDNINRDNDTKTQRNINGCGFLMRSHKQKTTLAASRIHVVERANSHRHCSEMHIEMHETSEYVA